VIPPPAELAEVQEDLNTIGEGVDEFLCENRDDPEWVPGLSYLQRKLQSSTTADNVAYKLCSRLVCRSEQETGVDNEQAEAVSLQESENILVNTHSKTPLGKNKPAMSHSYNLRSRVESTQSNVQE